MSIPDMGLAQKRVGAGNDWASARWLDEARQPPAPDPRFSDMPVAPRAHSQDQPLWIDPITGKQGAGGSTMMNYRNNLKNYFDENEGAEDYYNQQQAPIIEQETAQREARTGRQDWSILGHQLSPQEIARQQEAKAAYQASPAFAAAVKNFSQPLRGSPLQQTGGSTSGSPVGLGNMMRQLPAQNHMLPRNSGNQLPGNQLPGGGQFPGLGQGLGGMGLIGQKVNQSQTLSQPFIWSRDPFGENERGLFQPTTRFSDMPVAPSRQAQEIAQMQMKQQEAAAKNFSQPLRGSPLQQIGAGSSPFGSGNMRQAVMGQPSPRQAQSQGIVPMLAGPRGRLAGVGFDTSSLTPAYQRARRSAFRI
jgi:hypothetical protein